MVKSGKFREDLFFRLRVVEIWLPPLRDRQEDIGLLAQAFLKEFAETNHKEVGRFTPEAMDLLLRYGWPGNVRELRTAVEHAVVLSRADRITPRDLPPWVRNAPADPVVTQRQILARDDLTVEEAEKELIVQALKQTEGNRTQAAKKLGMSRRNLHRKLHEYNLQGV